MENQNLLIVGASSGIGQSVHQLAKEKGYSIFTMGRQEFQSSGHIIFDARKPFIEIPDTWPTAFSGLIYCPGTINLKPIQRLSSDDFLDDFQVNVLGFVHVVQAMLPRLKKSEGASIVTFSSVAAQVGIGFHASVAAAKGGLQSLSISLAAELAPQKIRVNVIAPSLTDTPLAASFLNNQEKREAAGKRHPLNRVGNSKEIADLVLHLLGTQSSWITGQVFNIDGGLSKIR